MSGLPSEEVAEDYKSSLEDLVTNDKFQIGNLTVIAKENIEHAMAISRALESHIRTVPPPRKLPAIYVLDSIVKNVGTPYTLILGRELFKTFMSAYTVVDAHTRKKLDEMLATWKMPIPGSHDNKPVFPPETTRPIENALIKARTAAIQSQQARERQQMGRGGTPMGYRNTPTPPQYGQPPPPNGRGQVRSAGLREGQKTYQVHPQPYPQQRPQPERFDLGALHRDIDNLIGTTRTEFAHNPMDPNIQQRLKALLDLKNILSTQQLPPDQLQLIRDQVSKLAPQPAPVPTPQSLPMHLATPVSASAPVPAAPLPTPVNNPPASAPGAQPPFNFSALLQSGRLAEIVQAAAQQRQTPTPPVAPPAPVVPPSLASLLSGAMNTPPPMQNAPASAPAENPLIASLRAQGLIGPNATPLNLPFVLPPPSQAPPPSNPTDSTGAPRIEVPLTNASIKILRPNLLQSLYDAKPNRCSTCGLRFHDGAAGKEAKANHLDWHFKTNQRMAEATRRGQNRSWYVDEREWIRSREDDSNDTNKSGEGGNDASGNTDGGKGEGKIKKIAFIPVPNDPALRNLPCPICQELFESTWSEEAQEWIWTDAVKKGTRVYHDSCYREVTKEGEASAAAAASAATAAKNEVKRQGTPDSVLGKRKAEENEDTGFKTKIKTEGVAY